MRFLDKAMFWVAVAGIAAVIGGALVLAGVALRPQRTTVWSEPWFDAGIGCLALGVVFLIVAVRHYFAEQGKLASALVGRTAAAIRLILSGMEWRSPFRSPLVRRASRPMDTSGRLTILRATYGGADVSERVRSLVRSRLAFTADNGTLVDDIDPESGVFKHLEIEYCMDGAAKTASFDEGAPVDLP